MSAVRDRLLRVWLGASALAVAGCTFSPAADRSAANAASQLVTLTDTLKVRVQGGAILSFEAPEGDAPAKVVVRAQSLDLRLVLTDSGCDPVAVHIEAQNLPRDELLSTRRILRGALSVEAAATRAAAGASLTLAGDADDKEWTPVDAEGPFETATEDGTRSWTVLSDRGRGRVRTASGLDPALVAFANTPAAGACVSTDAALAGPLAAAPLITRHRLRAVPPSGSFHFAVWGNNGGDPGKRARIAAAVEATAPRFVIINGDLTADGTAKQLEAARNQLDELLTVPYFPGIGDNEAKSLAFVSVFGQSAFAFDIADARIIALDAVGGGLSSDAFEQLSDWLGDSPLWWPTEAAPTQHIVLSHIPPFDPHGLRGEGFTRRASAGRLLATLARADVAYLIASQFAIFERQTMAGLQVVHSGGGGVAMEDGDTTGHHWLDIEVGHDCTPANDEGLEEDALCTPTESGSDCGGGLYCREETARCTPCVSVTAVPID